MLKRTNINKLNIPRPKTIQELWDKVISQRMITSTNCWRYCGYINKFGYGVVVFKTRRIYVHRLSGVINLGVDLNNLKENVCHKDDICNHRDCFNPDHLYKGNKSTNMRDAIKKGTHVVLENLRRLNATVNI
jgi:hypothetical protein